MLLLAGALLALSGLGVDSGVGSLVPWLALAGLAIGLVTTPPTTAALTSTDAVGYGTIAGVFSTFRLTRAGARGRDHGAILAAFGPGAAFARGFDSRHHAAFVDGLSTALTVNVAIALFTAVLAALMMRRRSIIEDPALDDR